MRFLDRFRNEREEERENPEPQGGVGGNLGELRAAAESLLAAGADAINRTLSQNSEAYLSSTRQEGGQ
jgi:hypothetical protein